MASSRNLRWLVVAVLAAWVATLVCTHPIAAQENGRGGDRGWRRNGDRPRGDGPRGRNREDESANAPADTKPGPTAPPASTSTSFGTTSDAEKIRKSATDTIKRLDKSGDGILAGDELNELGMSKAADANGDGKITHDELVTFRTPKPTAATATAVKPTTTTAASSGTEPAKSGERKLVNDTRKSYRFKSTKDRLTSWSLAGRDKNGDGQVSMSEYSRSWSDRTAAEFQRYDLDGDGMITSEEKH
jgi:Ca2+-binding EF-hand superfamily protein